TATNPILYVSSSDSRMGGPEGDLNLDTNSGIVSKLTKTPTGWQKVDLVRGLPRSEENHATNGLQLDGNKLYLVVGGHTNAGSPSTNFAYTPEYALAACVLSIDLAVIEALPTRGSGNTAYKYDLPTLDDPDRAGNPDANDPFGGNDGLNQAKLVAGGPVQVFATGFRNAYDLVITRARKMYVTDNGANPGWGGHPASEGVGTATNNYVTGEPGSTGSGPNDPKVNNLDNFHYVGDLRTYVPGSFYGGHPHPIRANPAGAGLYTHNGTSGVWRTSTSGPNPLPSDWPPVPVSMAHPIEGDFQNPGETDNALLTFPASSNGIVEYTASGFNNGLKGHLLVASFDGTIQTISLTADGRDVTNSRGAKKKNLDLPFASNFGSQPLDITAQGDNDIFPGTVWVVCYLQNQIYVFEPEAAGGGCSAAYSTGFDDDGDGYSNADEIDNASNPCSASSRPSDADGDKISDLNDPDDDNDGLADEVDYFALDASNGMNTTLPLEYNLFNNDPGTGLFGLGFTGLMLPMRPGIDYMDLFDEDNLIAGGAVGAFSVVNTTPGDPYQPLNNQENGFQFGINTDQSTGPFTVQTRLLGPFFNNQPPEYWQALGLFIGIGDQDNYLKVVLGGDGGTAFIEVLYENNGLETSTRYSLPGGLPNSTLDLYLAVNPATGRVQPKYAKDGGAITNLGPAILVGGKILEAIQGPPALAVGILSTSLGSTPFTATWDLIRVTKDPLPNTAPVLTAPGSKTVLLGQALTFTAQATDSDLPAQTLSYSVSGAAGASINASTGAFSWTPTTTGTFSLTLKVADNGSPALSAQQVFSVTVSPQSVLSLSITNATTGQPIRVIAANEVLNLNTLPERLNIRATTNPGTVGSVVFVLSGQESRTQTETAKPYELFGDNSTWRPAVGSYTLKATPYSGASGQGTAGTPLTVNFTVVNIPVVTSFSLMNAATEAEIRQMAPGEQLNLATLPTQSLNIRANTSPATVGSVKLVLSGKQNRTQTETGAPYSLFGDSNGNYNAWTPAVGSYNLTATPYTGAGATGTTGTALTLSFSVVNQPTGARVVTDQKPEVNGWGVRYFPNPFSDHFTIELQGAKPAKLPVVIRDLYGRTIMQLDDCQDGQVIQLGPQFGSGVYVLQIGMGRQARWYKLVKVR
ncbi:putative secreted protein (Por secretion system target), partial [Larkinella arboricola]